MTLFSDSSISALFFFFFFKYYYITCQTRLSNVDRYSEDDMNKGSEKEIETKRFKLIVFNHIIPLCFVDVFSFFFENELKKIVHH